MKVADFSPASSPGEASAILDELTGVTTARARAWADTARAAALATWIPTSGAPSDWTKVLTRLDKHARALHALDATARVGIGTARLGVGGARVGRRPPVGVARIVVQAVVDDAGEGGPDRAHRGDVVDVGGIVQIEAQETAAGEGEDEDIVGDLGGYEVGGNIELQSDPLDVEDWDLVVVCHGCGRASGRLD